MKARLTSYALAAVILLATWTFFVYRPLHRRHLRIITDTAEARHQLSDFAVVMSELHKLLKTREDLKSEESLVSSRLYTKEDLLKLFDTIEREAEQRRLTIKEISPPIDQLLYLNSLVPDSNEVQLLTITLRMQGGYVAFGQFVGYVEQSKYFRGVTARKIAGSRAGDAPLQLELAFSAR